MPLMAIVYCSYFHYFLSLGSVLLSTSVCKFVPPVMLLTLLKKFPVRIFHGISKFLTEAFVVFISSA